MKSGPKPIKPAEFAEKMREIAAGDERDTEVAHYSADDLLCKMLDDLGYSEGVTVFKGMKKWYA